MGKNQHSQDRMFITASEWKKQYGGHKTEKKIDARRMFCGKCFDTLPASLRFSQHFRLTAVR